MITFKNINTHHGKIFDFAISSDEEKIIHAENLMLLPAVIDPHVHFRTPGYEYKEDWCTGARAAIYGGCTMVFDMPNTMPPTITKELLEEKKHLIDTQLSEVEIPLRYQLFFGADKNHFDQIPLIKDSICGIKVFMGCSTGNLVMDDDESLHEVFSIAAKNNLLIAVHAEDEALMKERRAHYAGPMNYSAHSQLRDISVAVTAVEKAIMLSEQYGTRLYILHVSSAEEVALIEAAKKKNLSVFAETTPHHLFLNTDSYYHLGGKAVVNPPLRDKKHQDILFEAISDHIIDTIGSDHAPHTLEEKSKAYGMCPSGMPGIEFTLPLLLNAHREDRISLENIVAITSSRARDIFNLLDYQDYVIVDLDKKSTIKNTKSKCAWTPYEGLSLCLPLYTIIRGQCYSLQEP